MSFRSFTLSLNFLHEFVSLGHQFFHGFVLLLDAVVGLLQLPLQAFDRRLVFGNFVGQSLGGGLQAVDLAFLADDEIGVGFGLRFKLA